MRKRPNVELCAHARELGLSLSPAGARKMRATLGEDGARRRLAAVAALIDLASALGRDLSQLAATRRLDAAAGDYEVAASALVAEVQAGRQRRLDVAWNRLERRYYAAEARARHAAFLHDLDRGSLGTRAVLLLAAAEDAGLDAARFRVRLEQLLGQEIERRYPVRRESEWMVVDPDSAHPARVEEEIRRERAARQLALTRLAKLQQRVDAFADSARVHGQVERLLREIRARLADRVTGGWSPNPEAYRERVVLAALEESRSAA